MTTFLIQKNKKPWGTRFILDAKHRPGKRRIILLPRLVQRSSPGNRVKFLFLMLPFRLAFCYTSFSNARQVRCRNAEAPSRSRTKWLDLPGYYAEAACTAHNGE
jgi:hypothetical protein